MELPLLYTERLIAKVPTRDDIPELVAFQVRNAEFLKPYSPSPPDNFTTEAFWRERVETNIDEFHLGTSCRFHLFRRDEVEGKRQIMIGHASLTQIFRGPFNACYLGYSVDQEHEGEGYMYEGLVAVISYAFSHLALHRIMANYMPHNRRSGNLLRRLGFVVEGYARDYLMIDGEWEDHVLTSLHSDAWLSREVGTGEASVTST